MRMIYAVDSGTYNERTHVGVRKKVNAQINEFIRNGIEVKLCQYKWKNGQPQIDVEPDTNILYFRRIEPSIKFILKLRKLKGICPDIKIIMEIPTYPFEGEIRASKSYIHNTNKLIGTKLLKKYLDRIVLTASKPRLVELYGIPVIEMMNGVDFSEVTLKDVDENKTFNKINLIAVSGCFFWHGYDRLISGLANYYKEGKGSYDIRLHLVGEGPCLQEYRELIARNKLEGRVTLYGNLQGEELDSVYNRADIGIDVLGAHRKGMDYVGSLKSKEYVAKGLPIFTAVGLDIERNTINQYIGKIEQNDNAINVEKVIDFYNQIYRGKKYKEVAISIRKSFEMICDWKVTMKDLIVYMKNKECN